MGFNQSFRLNITEMNCEMTVTVRDYTIPAFTISICVVSDSHHGLVLFSLNKDTIPTCIGENLLNFNHTHIIMFYFKFHITQ